MYTQPAIPPRPAPGDRKKSVLIVEDDPISAQVMAKRLEILGFHCCGVAQESSEALVMAQERRPDLVLQDIRIPGDLDGIEVCDIIQTRHHIPVILVTAFTQEEITARAAAVNPYGLLFKPVDFAQLRVAMETALRKRAEEDLMESAERFRSTFEQAAVGMCHVRADGSFLRVNEQLCRMLGYSREDLGGRTFRDVTFPDDLASAAEALDSILADRAQTHTFEMRLCGKDGAPIWVLVTLSPAREASGSIAYLIAVIQDVTLSHRAAEELRENEETLRNILRGIRAAIFLIDPESKLILDANAIAEDLIGLSREELLGKSCCALDWQDKRGREIAGLCRFRGGGMVDEEMRLKKADGRVVPVMKTVIPGMRRGKAVLYEIVFDVSERKALERQLSIAQKLESVGELAAGVAHEINTPIQYIGDNLHYLQSAYADLRRVLDAALAALDLPTVREAAGEALRETAAARAEADLDFLSEEVPKSLEQSLEGVERVASIVRAMKKFAHPGGEEKTAVDINKAVETTILVARNEWKYVAELITDLDPDLPTVHCLPGDFNQVILNVLVNAAHAIGDAVRDTTDKGRISITTRREGDHIRLSIADTGTGIPELNREKIFDPFFTTKEVGRGTGQGLAIVHDIVVEKHDGAIDVESEVGKGTTFHIRIPIGGDTGARSLG
jgi:PAS domain S-box-containing protein